MRIHYDKSSDALYIKFSDNIISKTQQVADGIAIDLDQDTGIVGLEILYLHQRNINPYEIVCEYLSEESVPS